ncbi:MAG: hypothetical protein D4R74_04700 [Betaproteobacteria bacterium]|nr:MAG: hypothetical protein D4R74_04700 [Betaproteobacteria bacterium]
MPHAMEHCHRPWWKRPPFWFILIVAVLLVVVFVAEQTDKPDLTPYSLFLDQLEAGNVASVTFQGSQISGRYKRPFDGAPSGGKVQRDTFSSRVPDFGDPALIAELRKQHAVIDVKSPSPWASLLARLPWPMLLVLGVAIIAGFVRLMRGGKLQSGSAASALPAHGMLGLVSRLFAKRDETANPSTNDNGESKGR